MATTLLLTLLIIVNINASVYLKLSSSDWHCGAGHVEHNCSQTIEPVIEGGQPNGFYRCYSSNLNTKGGIAGHFPSGYRTLELYHDNIDDYEYKIVFGGSIHCPSHCHTYGPSINNFAGVNWQAVLGSDWNMIAHIDQLYYSVFTINKTHIVSEMYKDGIPDFNSWTIINYQQYYSNDVQIKEIAADNTILQDRLKNAYFDMDNGDTYSGRDAWFEIQHFGTNANIKYLSHEFIPIFLEWIGYIDKTTLTSFNWQYPVLFDGYTDNLYVEITDRWNTLYKFINFTLVSNTINISNILGFSIDSYVIVDEDLNSFSLQGAYMHYGNRGRENCWQTGNIYFDVSKILSGETLFSTVRWGSFYERGYVRTYIRNFRWIYNVLGETESPTPSPTFIPSDIPTKRPSRFPTPNPTFLPSTIPTHHPTLKPTDRPTLKPTFQPTDNPTLKPTLKPSKFPSRLPSINPTNFPTYHPTLNPSKFPSEIPTSIPTNIPTKTPTNIPTYDPTMRPSNMPTNTPTYDPTMNPTIQPSDLPTNVPTYDPTKIPTNIPTNNPTAHPSSIPSRLPTTDPTYLPTKVPSISPTNIPSQTPSLYPSLYPSLMPSNMPSNSPSSPPTTVPTYFPTRTPTIPPTMTPTLFPSAIPTLNPTTQPTLDPTIIPTNQPTFLPTTNPTIDPTTDPSSSPSYLPSLIPSFAPTVSPSNSPTSIPSIAPSGMPTISPSQFPTFSPTLPPTPNCPTLYVNVIDSRNRFKASAFNHLYTYFHSDMLFGRPQWKVVQNPYDRNIHYTGTNWIINGIGNGLLSHKSVGYYPPIEDMDSEWTHSSVPGQFHVYINCIRSFSPTTTPTDFPSYSPTTIPTIIPTLYPTYSPTAIPTNIPTLSPTQYPTIHPTNSPTLYPTNNPSSYPTFSPTITPTITPTNNPSSYPTFSPTLTPSQTPSQYPSLSPTLLHINPTTTGNLSAIYDSSIDITYELTNISKSYIAQIERDALTFTNKILEVLKLNYIGQNVEYHDFVIVAQNMNDNDFNDIELTYNESISINCELWSNSSAVGILFKRSTNKTFRNNVKLDLIRQIFTNNFNLFFNVTDIHINYHRGKMVNNNDLGFAVIAGLIIGIVFGVIIIASVVILIWYYKCGGNQHGLPYAPVPMGAPVLHRQ